MKTYITAKEFARTRSGWPKYSAVRQLIKDRETNGFNKVVQKIGGRFIICIEDFEKWIEDRKNTDI